MWWGGLSFYAIVVVPIGTNLIGSVEQGFITQQVTSWHNLLFLFFVICLCFEAILRRKRSFWAIVAILAVVNGLLFIGHAMLSRQMDFEKQTVPAGFYASHAIYLWITAVEWFAGIALPIWMNSSIKTHLDSWTQMDIADR